MRKPLLWGPLRLGVWGVANGALPAAAASPPAAPMGLLLCCCGIQRRDLGIWKALKPWGWGPRDEEKELQQGHKEVTGPPSSDNSNSATATVAPAVASAPATTTLIAATRGDGIPQGVIRSRLVRAPERAPLAQSNPLPHIHRETFVDGISSLISKGRDTKGPCRGCPRWVDPPGAWRPLADPELRSQLHEIFVATSPRSPEPRRREEPPLTRQTAKPLGPLLTRLSRSPLFLRASRRAGGPSAATTAPAAAAEDDSRLLFRQLLDFYFSGATHTAMGAPQRLLAAGGVRVMHPSRTRGAPDAKTPDLTEDQFSTFALVC